MLPLDPPTVLVAETVTEPPAPPVPDAASLPNALIVSILAAPPSAAAVIHPADPPGPLEELPPHAVSDGAVSVVPALRCAVPASPP